MYQSGLFYSDIINNRRRFVPSSEVSWTHPPENLITDERLDHLNSLTTIEYLRKLPADVRETFLPLLLKGATIYYDRYTPWTGEFWINVKFYLFY